MNAIAANSSSRHWRCLALATFGLGWTLTGYSQGIGAPPLSHIPGTANAGAFPSNDPNDNGNNLGRFNRGFGSGNAPFGDFSDFAPLQPLIVYFPPAAPRLGAHVDLPSMFEARKPAPPELAPFINEPFYAPLSTRLAQNMLNAKQRQRLDAYLAAKLRLQNELRSHLAELTGADLAERQREYAALARTEDPEIDALEQTAQQLRVDLIHGEFFQANVDWNNNRLWRLGNTSFRSAIDAIAAQYQVMRSAAFYQNGFQPAQRRLLLEVSMELGDMPVQNMDSAEPADGAAPTDTNPPLFFSPETSRVHLPNDLPQDLADKIAKYEQDKSALKKELRDNVYHEDSVYFGFARTHSAAVLSQQQQGPIAALEAQAEEIRRGLANLPNPPHPPDPPDMPPALVARITKFLSDKLAVQKDLALLLADARRNLEIQRVGYTKTPEGKYLLNLSIRPSEHSAENLKKLQDSFAAFNRTAGARSAALEKDLTIIRTDVATLLDTGKGPAGGKAIDRFLSECADTLEAREDWDLYRDYRIAVLEPGLSPQQRRLLFDGALVDLGLPLPGLEHGPVESDLTRRAAANAPPLGYFPTLPDAGRNR
jgi:hypothetical protein